MHYGNIIFFTTKKLYRINKKVVSLTQENRIMSIAILIQNPNIQFITDR